MKLFELILAFVTFYFILFISWISAIDILGINIKGLFKAYTHNSHEKYSRWNICNMQILKWILFHLKYCSILFAQKWAMCELKEINKFALITHQRDVKLIKTLTAVNWATDTIFLFLDKSLSSFDSNWFSI